jgi:hypothetical protein
MISDFLDEKNDSFDITNAIDNDDAKENTKDVKDGGSSKTIGIKKAKKEKKLAKEGKKLAKKNVKLAKIDGAFLEYKEILNEFAALNSYIGGKLDDPHINFSDITDIDIYERNEFSGRGECDLEILEIKKNKKENIEENQKEFSINDAI